MKRLIIILLICLSVQFLWAKIIVIKMATLAPEGTEWHGILVDLGQQWTEATNG